MLHVERSQIGRFDHTDVSAIFRESGWKALLPNALSDSQLLRAAQDLRTLLSNDSWDPNYQDEGPAIPMTLLLLEACRKEGHTGEGSKFEMSTLQEVMAMLSLTVDREIVSRLLGVASDDADEALTVVIGLLADRSAEPAQRTETTTFGRGRAL